MFGKEQRDYIPDKWRAVVVQSVERMGSRLKECYFDSCKYRVYFANSKTHTLCIKLLALLKQGYITYILYFLRYPNATSK